MDLAKCLCYAFFLFLFMDTCKLFIKKYLNVLFSIKKKTIKIVYFRSTSVCGGYLINLRLLFNNINNMIHPFLIRLRSRMLCMLKSNSQHGKMSEYNKNVWSRWRCMPVGNPLGQYTIFFTRCPKTVLRIEAMFDQGKMLENT